MISRKSHQHNRRGMLLVEVTIGMLTLIIVSIVIAQAMVVVDRVRHSTQQFDIASRELENLLTEYSSQPYDKLNNETAGNLTLNKEASTLLPDSKLSTRVVEEQDPDAKRITFEISLAADVRAKPITLTTWVLKPLAPPPTADESDEEES